MARRPGCKSRWVVDDGEPVVGLRYWDTKDRRGRKYRQYATKTADGKTVYFGKDNEREAIRQFRLWQAKQTGAKVAFKYPIPEFTPDPAGIPARV